MPGVFILLGLLLIIVKLVQGQNAWFLMGGLAILIVGIVALLNAMERFDQKLRMIIMSALVLISLGLTVLDYKSIKDPLDFMKERDLRYTYVKQRLLDIKHAQMAYKSVKGGYTSDFDELLMFIQNDSFIVIKAIGQAPDSLMNAPEDSLVAAGIIIRDTSLVPVQDSLYSSSYLKDREHPFYVDSLPYLPYCGGIKFAMQAGQIERNNVMVSVLQVTDSKPYDKRLVYQLGSMTEPSLNGNWE